MAITSGAYFLMLETTQCYMEPVHAIAAARLTPFDKQDEIDEAATGFSPPAQQVRACFHLFLSVGS